MKQRPNYKLGIELRSKNISTKQREKQKMFQNSNFGLLANKEHTC